jgi:hypothetical protein
MQHVMRHAKATAERAVPSGEQPERTIGKYRTRTMWVHQADVTERTR